MAYLSRASHLTSLGQPLVRGLLARSGLEELSLGAPRLWPARPSCRPAPDLARALGPQRRRLWRRRASCALARSAAIGLALVLLIGLAAHYWDLRPTVAEHLLPLAICLMIGLWLAIAQRPTLLETAQLLDGRHRLRELLSTAVELSAAGDPGPLHARQIALAHAQLTRLPSTNWGGGRRSGGLLVPPLLVTAAASLLLTPAPSPRPLSASPTLHSRPASHAPALAAQTVPLQRGVSFPGLRNDRQDSPRGALASHVPLLAMSLQVRLGPQDGVDGGTAAPGYLSGAMGGQSSNGGMRTGGTGSHGTVQPGHGGASGTNGNGAGGQGGDAGQGNQQGGGGQGGQGPQSGPQANPGQVGGSQGATGNNQDPTKGLPQNGQGGQQPPQDANGSPQGAANPFGQDQPLAKQRHTAGSPRTGSTRGAQGAGKQAPNSRPPGSQTGSRATNGHSPDAGNEDDLLHRHLGNSAPSPGAQPSGRPGRAGAATGPQINLGGHFVLGYGAGSPELVRVLPLGAASGAGMDGSTTIGSPIVQGYVPENATTLGPDDQALVRAYFSGGSN